MGHFLAALVAIGAIGIGLETLDGWYADRKERIAGKVKRARWHKPSQYIMTDQDWGRD